MISPYASDDDDMLAHVCQTQLFVFLIASIVLKADSSDGTWELLDLMLTILNIVPLFLAFAFETPLPNFLRRRRDEANASRREFDRLLGVRPGRAQPSEARLGQRAGARDFKALMEPAPSGRCLRTSDDDAREADAQLIERRHAAAPQAERLGTCTRCHSWQHNAKGRTHKRKVCHSKDSARHINEKVSSRLCKVGRSSPREWCGRGQLSEAAGVVHTQAKGSSQAAEVVLFADEEMLKDCFREEGAGTTSGALECETLTAMERLDIEAIYRALSLGARTSRHPLKDAPERQTSRGGSQTSRESSLRDSSEQRESGQQTARQQSSQRGCRRRYRTGSASRRQSKRRRAKYGQTLRLQLRLQLRRAWLRR